MKPFLWIDDRLLALTAWVVEWLEEWFSVSQARLELSIVVAYAFGRVLLVVGVLAEQGEGPIWLLVVLSVYFVWWMRHSRRRSVHLLLRIHWIGVLMRFMFLFFFLADLPGLVTGWNLYRSGDTFSDLSLALFVYVISVSSDGQSGRRRKMALAKLKELFGPLWVPAWSS